MVANFLGSPLLPYQHANIGPMYGFTSAHFAIVGPTSARSWGNYVLAIGICPALGRCWADAPVRHLSSVGPMLGQSWADVGPMSGQCWVSYILPQHASPALGQHRSGICPALGRHRADIGPISGRHRPDIGPMLGRCQHVGPASAQHQPNIGPTSAKY